MEGSALTTALTNITSVMTTVASIITGNVVLMTMFAGGLLTVGATVFKRLKNAVKN